MREACARAGITPAVGFHVLRHTQRHSSHSDTRMTERHYAHLAPNYVTDTIRADFLRLTTPDARVVSIGRVRAGQRNRV
jgi:integrase